MSSSLQRLTVDEAFAESILHDRHLILGREMKPLCIDHLFILNALKSPLVLGGPIEIQDLQLAVKACSTSTTAEFYDAARRPDFYWRLWTRVTRAFPVPTVLRAFNSYVEDYIPRIPRFNSGYDDDEVKCPPVFINAGRLVKAGIKPAEVRRMGIGEITAWVLAIAEGDGDPLKSIPSRAYMEAVAEIAAEEAAKNV
jgi:hypothetical protein